MSSDSHTVHLATRPSDPSPLLFVIGLPRSGTKLLRRLLNGHTDIFLAHELLFVPRLIRRWTRYGDVASRSGFERLYRDIARSRFFIEAPRFGHPPPTLEAWRTACTDFSIEGVLRGFIRTVTHAPAHGTTILGDKSPSYFTDVESIVSAIPTARFIHIVRDVRDAAVSARRAWGKNIYRYAQRWRDALASLNVVRTAVSPEQIMHVRYETLVSQPEYTLNTICDWLGVEFQQFMLKLDKPSESLGQARGAHHVLINNTGSYKEHLPCGTIRQIEAISLDMLNYYGYPILYAGEPKRLSRIRMAAYRTSDITNQILFQIHQDKGLTYALRANLASLRR